ncbi:IS1 family transposase, partial [Aeromonas veronii]
IERNNLTLRTRIKRLARKTICFSRSIELHEKVIGAFIERHHFNCLESLPCAKTSLRDV